MGISERGERDAVRVEAGQRWAPLGAALRAAAWVCDQVREPMTGWTSVGGVEKLESLEGLEEWAGWKGNAEDDGEKKERGKEE